jgi:hypothetical protein
MTLRFARATATLNLSYTAPFSYFMRVRTTESEFSFEDGLAIVRGPRESVDTNGRFCRPPIQTQEGHDLYADSLQASVAYFMEHVRSGAVFAESQSARNLLSTEFFLRLVAEHSGQ